jgi:acyl-CoA synthetase (AMP-forming)/AMP-acid ligase II
VSGVTRPKSRTLPGLLDELAARQPDHELIVGGGARLSYAETRRRARELAKGLRRLGVVAGDRVALVMTNRPEWLLIDFAVTMLGATLVPISTWSRPRSGSGQTKTGLSTQSLLSPGACSVLDPSKPQIPGSAPSGMIFVLLRMSGVGSTPSIQMYSAW